MKVIYKFRKYVLILSAHYRHQALKKRDKPKHLLTFFYKHLLSFINGLDACPIKQQKLSVSYSGSEKLEQRCCLHSFHFNHLRETNIVDFLLLMKTHLYKRIYISYYFSYSDQLNTTGSKRKKLKLVRN
jgi:hypothetical protein